MVTIYLKISVIYFFGEVRYI